VVNHQHSLVMRNKDGALIMRCHIYHLPLSVHHPPDC
jgi:hypothetical protein